MSSLHLKSRTQNRPAHVLIDSEAFVHNLNVVKTLAPNSKVMTVIKADGYGHGMETAAHALAEFLDSGDEIGVTAMDDVQHLRSVGVDATVTMLSAQLDLAQLNSLAEINVRTVFYDHSQLSLFEQVSSNANLDLWLKVDTGMGRLGVLPDELPFVYKTLSAIEGIRSLSLMSHLANADDPNHVGNQRQIESILTLANEFDFRDISVLNSAGIVHYSAGALDMVRPGLMLYGISPTIDRSADQLGLKPAMTFKSELISVKRLPAGSRIGYGSTYTLAADSRIGIVAVGYGDGYPRHAPSGTPVLVNGVLVPLVGRVSMDMITVDLSDMNASVGDEIVLWGADNPIENIAAMAGTIAYELTCGVLPRVERIVI